VLGKGWIFDPAGLDAVDSAAVGVSGDEPPGTGSVVVTVDGEPTVNTITSVRVIVVV